MDDAAPNDVATDAWREMRLAVSQRLGELGGLPTQYRMSDPQRTEAQKALDEVAQLRRNGSYLDSANRCLDLIAKQGFLSADVLAELYASLACGGSLDFALEVMWQAYAIAYAEQGDNADQGIEADALMQMGQGIQYLFGSSELFLLEYLRMLADDPRYEFPVPTAGLQATIVDMMETDAVPGALKDFLLQYLS